MCEINYEIEVGEDEQDSHAIASNETTMLPKVPIALEASNATIAPGEGQTPIPTYNDKFCEEMAFPHLFPTGKFGYKALRNVPISAVKYFNQRLLNYTQKFASDTDYIFFANHVMQEINLHNKINIAMKKIRGSNFRAGMVQSEFQGNSGFFNGK